MSQALELTDYQRELCSGSEALFFLACIECFGFLVTEHGYHMSFHPMGKGCYQALFKQDIQTEYFAVRLFHESNHLWCEIERFAGLDHQRRLRLSEAVRLFSFAFPSEHLDVVLPDEQTIPQRVRAFADCIRAHLADFRNMPVHSDK
jgi:hypothetical protein